MRTPSPIVRYVSRRAAPVIQLYALYVLGHGEDGPGGGFQGGVIFASSFVLLALAHGRAFGRRAFPEPVGDTLLPLGCILYAGIGVASLLLGGAFLEYGVFAGGASDEHTLHLAHEFGLMGIELGVMITVSAAMATLFFEMARVIGPGPQPDAPSRGGADA